MPVTSSAFASAFSGPSSFSICASSQRSIRLATLSRDGPVSCSSAISCVCGFRATSPAASFATGSPFQRKRPSFASTILSSPALSISSARFSISPASAFCAAALSAFASGPPPEASAANSKPCKRPMTWPSTTTSPLSFISVSKRVFSLRRRISTLVRRSTKRWVRRSCKASERRSSTARVMPCQCSGSRNQSGRFAAKVQVRTCAMRFESVSMSPSGRSARATCSAIQSAGMLPSRIKNP